MLALVLLTVGLEFLQGIGLGDFAANDGLVLLGEFLHLGLDLGEVVLGDGCAFGWHDVVEEAILNGRSETELNAGIELLQSLCQKVGGGVPEGVLTLFVLKLIEGDGGIFIDGSVQLCGLTIHAATHNVACQSR